jgi:hypothetical protein
MNKTPKVFCEECQCVKQESKVYLKYKTINGTRSVFWDEKGEKHIHDKTSHQLFFTCSFGHIWDEINFGKCIDKSCGWDGKNFAVN